jgi:hypothetical protein
VRGQIVIIVDDGIATNDPCGHKSGSPAGAEGACAGSPCCAARYHQQVAA